jgi:threonine synthase
MHYISTRNKNLRVRASEAILNGLAPDGGLFVPESIPSLSKEDVKNLCGAGYAERAARIMKLFLDEFTPGELESFAQKAYSSERFPLLLRRS